ncbi:MAG: tetrahydromethanopterin S-methyltransferase subunit B [ANME-2 cluster archaeon]|nr:tetrahydromethanopterin S-methyltransferase subunit B [ANME-2 cluster archaeon]MDF1558385.1 tetrahydromethanopterin S-methyltransferase subunit B [ANME-2 cluster archaeon]
MSHVRVAPEFHLILEPMSGILAEEREDILEYSLDHISTVVDELDRIAEDMMNSLGPDKPLLATFPGREKAAVTAGIWTNIFYGFIGGLILMTLIAVLMKLGGL